MSRRTRHVTILRAVAVGAGAAGAALMLAACGSDTRADVSDAPHAPDEYVVAHDDHEEHSDHPPHAGPDEPEVTQMVRVGAGDTLLNLNPLTWQPIEEAGAQVSTTDGAQGAAPGIAFPMRAGRIDAYLKEGVIEHGGALRIRSADGRLSVLSAPSVDFATGILSVSLGGVRVPLLTLDGAGVGVSEDGGGGRTIAGISARLTAEGARALNRAAGLPALHTNGRPRGAARMLAAQAPMGTLTMQIRPPS